MKRMKALFAAMLIVASLGAANYVAWLRLHPEVSAVESINEKAKYNAHVVMLHQRAMERVDPGTSESYLPVYDAQNPGLFLLVAELAIRAGATTPLPLEVLSILLFNIGALCFFFWVYLLFSDVIAATFATVFLVLSQFFLFFSGVTHTMPYEFVFFNLTLLLFLLYLKRGERVYLVGSLLAMFLMAMNYWFYYMSSWIVMVGLWWQYRGRPRLRDVALISAPLVAAATLTAAMIMFIVGGFTSGILRMLDLFVARTVDARMPNSHWYPGVKFVSAADWDRYPDVVASRLEWAYSFDLQSFSIAAGCAVILLSIRKRSSAVSALILLLGSLSWYFVMLQHTFVHSFSGMYSFLGICPLFGLMIAEAVVRLCDALSSTRACFTGGSIRRAVLSTCVAGVMVVVSWWAVVPFYRNSVGLIKKTVAIAADVEKKYRLAVQDACRDNSKVTLEELKGAAQAWGFQWTPEILAATNQMPTCSRYSSVQ
ncbi:MULTISPECIES: hypothetical protein [Bradyrhizobium]|uniref:hypothetical protein n=1 Tax=Bradyrhizobium TaxID=374 RepID=UPI001B8A4020|nr:MULTISPECIES: hypothetical protein [Bradyrhizobium]MBR0974368.1 hypothetical protein [Bradyrhizobium japonicum]